MRKIASLLREPNVIDEKIADTLASGSPPGLRYRAGDLTVAAAIDGRFRAGPLQGCTVNVKWYLKRKNLIDFHTGSGLKADELACKPD